MHRERAFRACRPGNIRAGFWVMIVVGCGSSGGSEVLRFRSSGAAGVLVNNGAGVTPHRWLKVAFIPSHLVKATFSHNRTASEATRVTPTTGAPPEPRSAPPEEAHPTPIGGRTSPKYGTQRPQVAIMPRRIARSRTNPRPNPVVRPRWVVVRPGRGVRRGGCAAGGPGERPAGPPRPS